MSITKTKKMVFKNDNYVIEETLKQYSIYEERFSVYRIYPDGLHFCNMFKTYKEAHNYAIK